MDESLQAYWDEIIGAISDIESHGDAIEYVRNAMLTSGDVTAVSAERDAAIAERDAAIAERDAARNEIASRWKDLTNGGSITVVTDYSKGDTKNSVNSVNDLNFDELLMNGGTE